MKLHLPEVILLGVAMLVPQAVLADPIDAAAVQRAKQIRDDVVAKQKALQEEPRADVQKATAPAEPLQLPVDETDSPGATKQ